MIPSFGLFERFGVELEYMIVDAETLEVRPIADRLIEDVSGSVAGDVARGRLEWSNELALHLIELKTGTPAKRLAGLDRAFQSEVAFINRWLARRNARLLPTAMHPWMNPRRESRLWPHSNAEIYAAFHRIFNCAGHGWTNLQATHVNLPFRTSAEFRRLHAAVRVLLPILPALAASSPFIEGRVAPVLDMRLDTYRNNCRRIPSVTGRVIPEWVRSPTEYRKTILHRIYRDLAPLDPEAILREEWANARGAIARFERNTIEIRVLDIQECPRADLAILEVIVSVLRRLIDESLSTLTAQSALATADLQRLLSATVRNGGSTRIRHRDFLAAFGVRQSSVTTVRELWWLLLDETAPPRSWWRSVVETILQEGCLSARILKATGPRPNRARLRSVYGRLAECLKRGEFFHA
jgi:gamma-glutamyl:cysteine ligase YbdK (ATP-grasp superfamily)